MRELFDSGIDWLGDIPTNWNTSSLLNVLRSKICDGPHETPEITENGIPFISVDSLNDSKYIDLDVSKKNISEDKYLEYYRKAPLEEGDILFSKAATIGKTAIVDNRKFMVWSPLAIIKVDHKKCNNLYIYYLLNCERFIKHVSFLGGYNTQINVGMRALEKAKIPLPPLEEQRIIADYLDSKCSQIDTIITKQKTIIESLKEYKLSTITEAVTKGLNPSVELKDCEVEWIDQIPSQWKSIKLKNCSYIRARLGWKGLKAEEYVEEGFPLLSAFNIVDDKIDFEHNINYINEFRYDESPEIKLAIGDVLLVKDGAGIGKCGIVEELPIPSTTNGSLAVITTDEQIYPKYLYYYFLCSVFQQYINRIKDGMGVPHLFQSDLREIQIAIPSIEEQIEIVEQLDKKIRAIDNYRKTAESIIDMFQQYKKSLIFEVVTGKKEV